MLKIFEKANEMFLLTIQSSLMPRERRIRKDELIEDCSAFLYIINLGGTCMCCFIFLVEFSGSKRRGLSGSLLWLSGPVSYSIIALSAFFIRNWRYVMLTGALMASPVMIFIW